MKCRRDLVAWMLPLFLVGCPGSGTPHVGAVDTTGDLRADAAVPDVSDGSAGDRPVERDVAFDIEPEEPIAPGDPGSLDPSVGEALEVPEGGLPDPVSGEDGHPEGILDGVSEASSGDPGAGPDADSTEAACQEDRDCEGSEPPQCQEYYCNQRSGRCELRPAGNGTPCLLDACHFNTVCTDGVCSGTPRVCDDANPCTDDSCDPAQGCVFQNNEAACDDGNWCTVGDRCEGGVCKGIVACECQNDADCAGFEDGNRCNGTLVCEGGTCVVDPASIVFCDPSADTQCRKAQCIPETGACELLPVQDGTPCDDQNLCTYGDACVAGVCIRGSDVVCNDHNPCTNDSCVAEVGCVFVFNTAPCDDGNPCTTGDTCWGGSCSPGAPVVCDDQNPCTDDSCDPQAGGCAHVPNQSSCDDNNPCTTQDVCADGVCRGVPKDCEDGNPCTDDSCDMTTGNCDHVPTNEGESCSDGDLCTLGDVCSGGKCVGVPRVCTDGNPCTDDSCDKKTGQCLFPPNTNACDDGNPCTEGDVCSNSVCQGTPKNCDDQNVCTDDSCDPLTGLCVHSENSGPCDDGDPCTANDTCTNFGCAGTPVVCDDQNPCTDDFCDRVSGGCVFVPNQSPCDDGNACTLNDVCTAGECRGTQKNCDDVNSCTADSCDPSTGACIHVPANDGNKCSDGNLCTLNDICQQGKCVGTPKTCTDGNPCTDDSCDKKTGQCVFTPNTKPCNDGDPCTEGDVCSNNVCKGTPKNCDDQNVCTDDSCDPTTGQCLHAANHLPCDDGNRCTLNDTCLNGACVGTAVICDDGNVCTDDACNPQTGLCEFTPNSRPCDDGLQCTEKDTCQGGVCKGAPVTCDDQNVCTGDLCVEGIGCVHSYNDGLSCNDNNKCTDNDICNRGVCAGEPIKCADTNPCTLDGCDPHLGCVFKCQPNATSCGSFRICWNCQCVGVGG